MMSAGIKNKATVAQAKKKKMIPSRKLFELWGFSVSELAMRWSPKCLLYLESIHCKKEKPRPRFLDRGFSIGLVGCEVLPITQVHNILQFRCAGWQVDRVQEVRVEVIFTAR